MDTTLSLRLATRIHFALLRRYGENVPVADLIAGTADAQEAMWVCEACDDPDLRTLAARLVAARQQATQPAPQDAAWARNTSGFGMLLPSGFAELSAQPVQPAKARDGASR